MGTEIIPPSLGYLSTFISSQATNCTSPFESLFLIEYFQESQFLPLMKNSRLYHKENSERKVFQYHGQTASLKNTSTNNLTIRNKKHGQFNDRKKKISVPVQSKGKPVVASFR
ncbi:hypothetical protein TNCV_3797761 [Trichonephila clavipes]|nr:hypothetical protein TNCV_3797761 [Trichonephila clavipes]